MNGLPVTATVSEVLSLLKLRLHQGTAGFRDFVDLQVGPEADRPFRETCLAEVERVDVVAGLESPVLQSGTKPICLLRKQT